MAFSRQQLVSCAFSAFDGFYGSNACEGGSSDDAFDFAARSSLVEVRVRAWHGDDDVDVDLFEGGADNPGALRKAIMEDMTSAMSAFGEKLAACFSQTVKEQIDEVKAGQISQQRELSALTKRVEESEAARFLLKDQVLRELKSGSSNASASSWPVAGALRESMLGPKLLEIFPPADLLPL